MKKAILYFSVFIVLNLAVSFGVEGVYGLISGKADSNDITLLLIISATTSADRLVHCFEVVSGE